MEILPKALCKWSIQLAAQPRTQVSLRGFILGHAYLNHECSYGECSLAPSNGDSLPGGLIIINKRVSLRRSQLVFVVGAMDRPTPS
jgi:hypothetical protein